MVVNTHITCNWQHPDTQTAQVAIMMQEVARLQKECTTHTLGSGPISGPGLGQGLGPGQGLGSGLGPGSNLPEVVLCGDFNSDPDSGVYRLITEGYLHANDPDANVKEELGFETVLTTELLQHTLGESNLTITITIIPCLINTLVDHNESLS